MPRYRLDIEYDGTPYAGWQRQEGPRTVQEAIEQAVRKFCGETVSLRAAGRTDAGVHATAQVAHVDLAKAWPADTVRDALNAHLQMAGDTVAILAATVSDPDFDARIEPIRPPEHDDRETRWDGASVHAFAGTYGDYVLAKVGKVFPALREQLP